MDKENDFEYSFYTKSIHFCVDRYFPLFKSHFFQRFLSITLIFGKLFTAISYNLKTLDPCHPFQLSSQGSFEKGNKDGKG